MSQTCHNPTSTGLASAYIAIQVFMGGTKEASGRCKALAANEKANAGRGKTMKEVVVIIGPGQIGQAIARRVGFGKHILLADKRNENAKAAADILSNAGYDVTVATVDVSSRQDVHVLVEAARG
jgi:phosphoglycerate dehydrogenase-like enzyme